MNISEAGALARKIVGFEGDKEAIKFHVYLKLMMELNNITVKDFAQIGIGYKSLENYLKPPDQKYASTPSHQNLNRIIELFGFDEAMLITAKDDEQYSFGLPLKEKYVFDSFVVGDANKIARAAAMQVSINPGKLHNPLFIYGGSGLGKTHLMQAIGNHARDVNPNARIIYTNSEIKKTLKLNFFKNFGSVGVSILIEIDEDIKDKIANIKYNHSIYFMSLIEEKLLFLNNESKNEFIRSFIENRASFDWSSLFAIDGDQKDFPEYNTKKIDLYYVTITNYSDAFKGIKVIFNKDNITETLGEVLSKHGKKQIRIAETEKYPHVTFFFSGGQEAPFEGESRILKNSPKVATYDLKPEMSAYELKDALVPELEKGDVDFVCLNFANGDMVGHTGVMEAAIKACEAVDECVNEVVTAGLKNGYTTLLIADHGNCETMINPDGSPNTAHTTNPVPVILIDNELTEIKDGVLGDMAPTILKLMNVKQPAAMTQHPLV